MATRPLPDVKRTAQHFADTLPALLPSDVTHVVLRGAQVPRRKLRQHLLDDLSTFTAVERAEIALAQALRARGAVLPLLLRDLASLTLLTQATLGHDPQALSKAGVAPSKRRHRLTVAENAIKAAKALVTRRRNGTLGKRQRQKARRAAAARVVVLGPDGKPLPGGK